MGGKFGGMDLPKRLEWAMAHGKFRTQTKLAEKTGCPQSVISDLLRGVAGHSRYLTDIAIACKVSPQWLHTGKGERILGELEEVYYSLSEGDQHFFLDMMRARKATGS